MYIIRSIYRKFRVISVLIFSVLFLLLLFINRDILAQTFGVPINEDTTVKVRIAGDSYICLKEPPLSSPSATPVITPTATTLPPSSGPTEEPSTTPSTEPTPTEIEVTSTPGPTLPPGENDPEGEFPCGVYPNANPGCMAISFQSWFDDVPATDRTMSVDYTPEITHQHFECNLPIHRSNGQHLKQEMDLACRFVRYNHVTDFDTAGVQYRGGNENGGDNDGRREEHSFDIGRCQDSKYQGKECIDWMVYTNLLSEEIVNSSNEIRMKVDVKRFEGYDGGRHFITTNWQTEPGYRSNSVLINRYWHDLCGTYQRVNIPNIDQIYQGDRPIIDVTGTLRFNFNTNGGCGDRHKTYVFINPKQHTNGFGSQTGITLMDHDGQYDGELVWDTLNTTNLADGTTSQMPNGVHSLLIINLEGTDEYVSASGIALKVNIQN